MDRSGVDGEGTGFAGPEGAGSDLTAFIQQQIQNVFQAAVPHIVQQISDRTSMVSQQPALSEANRLDNQVRRNVQGTREFESGERESKVADPEKFSGKKGNEVYRWFAQLRLVFRGKPRTYNSDTDKVAYALSYMNGAAQNWAMPLLQALDEEREHELLTNYGAFRESVISVYGDLDRRCNAEDRLGRLRQTGSVAAYISSFNEYVAQVDWNEASLVARFRSGLKDEILDSVATAEAQPQRLHEWMTMASRIDERLWGRRQNRRQQSDSSMARSHATISRDMVGKFQHPSGTSEPVPMELGALRVTTAIARTAAERSEYQRQGRCWGCGEVGHVRAKCPTNPSKPLSLAAIDGVMPGKGGARD